jgi:hypothetical protein
MELALRMMEAAGAAPAVRAAVDCRASALPLDAAKLGVGRIICGTAIAIFDLRGSNPVLGVAFATQT